MVKGVRLIAHDEKNGPCECRGLFRALSSEKVGNRPIAGLHVDWTRKGSLKRGSPSHIISTRRAKVALGATFVRRERRSH